MKKCFTIKSQPLSWFYLLSVAVIGMLVASCAGTASGFRWTALDGSSLAFSSRVRIKGVDTAQFGKSHSQDIFSLKKGYLPPDATSLAVRVHSETGGAIIGLGWTGRDRKDTEPTKFALSSGLTTFYLRLGKSAEIKALAIKLEPVAGTGALPENVARIESIAFAPGFTGYEKTADGVRISDEIGVVQNTNDRSSTWTLRPLSELSDGEVLTLRYSRSVSKEITVKIGESTSLRLGMGPVPRTINVPLNFFPPQGLSGKISLTVPDSTAIEALNLQRLSTEEEGYRIDPGLMLLSQESTGSNDFAWYRWDLLPAVIMFDFKSYEIQDRYLKRLAFFVEKKGFVGRLASDSEIQALHGWNAHDYKTEDLARFFTLATKTGFALGPEEEQLRDFLVEKKLISRSGKDFKPLDGAMISIAKESPDYLRRTFLTHELSHAIFFSDSEYRQFCTSLWDTMESEEKWFWTLYFGWMNYNTSSSYLMANEMQAYLVQQSLPQVQEYFTKVLVDRLLETHEELKDPIDLYMGKFSPSFEARAKQVDAWLKAKYGFGAGRLYFVR